MSQKSCIICNAKIDGWIYDNQTIYPFLLNDSSLHECVGGHQCKSCGAVVCAYKHNKELKASVWGGLDKVICPACGGKFGPPNSILIREVSKAAAKDIPSNLINLYPWAGMFLDSINGEKLLTADQPELKGDNDFRLLLTDRRFIFFPPKKRFATVNAMFDPDLYCTIIPLRSIAAVEAGKPMIGGGTTLTIKTKHGQMYTYKSKVPFDNFGSHIQEAVPNAPSALTFPFDEIIHFDGGSNFKILSPRDFLSKKASEIHKNLFHNSYLISLAITNRRMLFYRINHVVSATLDVRTINAQLGKPSLHFISIPWENIRRIEVDRSFMGSGANIVLDNPVSGWMSNSLTVYSHAEDQMLAEVSHLQKILPPIGAKNQEWKLPITGNLKDWTAQILPSIQKAYPLLSIN